MKTKQTLIQVLFLFILAWPHWGYAKKTIAKKNTVAASGVNYSNAIDAALTIHKITSLPTVDNVDSIFSRPIDAELKDLLSSDHQWEWVDSHFTGQLVTVSQLIKDPEQVIKIGRPLGVDALLIVEVRKNPKDMVVSLNLFGVHDGRLITQLTASDLPQTSTDKALAHMKQLYTQIKYKIPYDGLVLSRIKNRVTINLGQIDHIQPGQILNCSKIVNVSRHPKLDYIMQNDKALLGTIKVLKVDRALSFGDVISEVEAGAIQKDSKITGARPVRPEQEDWIKKDYLPPEMVLSKNNELVQGSEEWKPADPPTFGQISVGAFLGPYQNTVSLRNNRTLSTKTTLYPAIQLDGEMWLNPEWFINVGILQGTAVLKNPVSGGAPKDLTSTIGQYTFDVGYNLLLKDDFWDAKLFFALGLFDYKMSVDNSDLQGITSQEYKSLRITLGGKTPVDDAKRWYFGGVLYWYVNPSLHEKPFSYGSDSNKIVHFTITGDYRWSERVFVNSSLDFKTFSTDFSGIGSSQIPAEKSTQRFNTLYLGVSYMF